MSPAGELLRRFEKLEVKLWADQGQLRFRSPKGVMTEALKAQLRERKAELLAMLSGRAEPIPRLAEQPTYALSHAQRRMWVLTQLEAGSAAYNVPLHQMLQGSLDVEALQQAIEWLVQRHESLRTSFLIVDGEPRQRVHDQVDASLDFMDLSDRDEPLKAAKQLARRHSVRLFDLRLAPPFRAALLKTANRCHVLLLTIHHIVCDGFSIGILTKELAQLYDAARRGNEDPLPALRIQYRDYAAWQNLLLERGALAAHRDWWLASLGGKLPVLNLPTDNARPAQQTFNGRELAFRLGTDQFGALIEFGHRHGASLYMTLLTILYLLLYRYTGQEDLIVGSPVAGRGHPGLDGQVGLYLNTLALRSRIDGDSTFVDFLAGVRSRTAQAYDHQSLPFDQLVDELNLRRDLSRNPLFDVTMTLQNQEQPELSFHQISVQSLIEHPGTSKTDLSFNFSETAGRLDLGIEYNTDLFAEDRIARMGAHFKQIVDSVLHDPGQRLCELNLLTPGEKQQLLVEFNATSRPFPSDKTVLDLFQQQVRTAPDAIAVQCEDALITYSQLSQRTAGLAGRLISLGVGRNVLAGIFLNRSIEMVAALLGVLKAGGGYVPMDPSFPRQRLALMLDDSQAPVLLTERKLLERLPRSEARAVCLVSDRAPGSAEPLKSHPCATADDPAYVIYTSGSTGRPKGVSISHRALVNFLCSMAQAPGLCQEDVLLAVTTLSFDIAALEIFLPLIRGARLVVAKGDTAADGVRLLKTLEQCGATVMQATPATWRMLLATGWRASPQLKVLCGGEALPGWLAGQLLERCASVWNMYGPTETTIWSTLRKLDARDGQPRDTVESIGRPIANTEIYILDRHLQPLPIGLAGDLHIGGDGLAIEYFNQPDLTAEKFLPHPFRSNRRRRIYKTGDTACYQPDGNIRFLGRADHQVKLRGFRIELGEIEAALAAHPGIEQAIVEMRDDGADDRLLAAWYLGCADESLTPGELRDHLGSKLPDYMIPSLFVPVPDFPLTPNGKVDRGALILPRQAQHAAKAYEPPRTPTEKAIAAIWREVLQAPQVGIYDNFFELGGHSLKATQVISRMHRELSVEIALREIFSHPTVAALAQSVVGKQSSRYAAIPKAAEAEHYELSHAQRRLWVLSQMEGGLAAYNLPDALLLEGDVDAQAIQSALDAVIKRHESLRTCFPLIDGQPRQKVLPRIDPPFGQIDLSRLADPERQARRLALSEAVQPFDLSEAGLLRVSLLKLASNRHVLLFNIHHIIADQWSLELLVREFAQLYNAPSDLAPLRIQYRDYACWQNRYLHSDAAAAHRDYWHSKLAGDLPALDLPADFPRPAVKSFNGKTCSRRIGRGQAALLESFSRQRGASLFMTLVAAVKTLLYRYTGQEDLIVGSPIAGRNHADLESQIGFYVNTLPLRDRLRADMSFEAVLDLVRTTCSEAYQHQIYPFDRLVDELGLARDVSRNPLFDVAVALQYQEPEELLLSGLKASSFIDGYGGSKYDVLFAFEHRDGQLEMAIHYNTDLFRAQRIERMSRHLEQALASLLDEPGQTVGCLNILTKSEHEQLLSFNPGRHSFECRHSLARWFEARAAERPDAIAVVCPPSSADQPSASPEAARPSGRSLTYGELNARANQLARHLGGLGLQPNVLAGLYVEASLDTVVSILAIVKSGGAYLPLDTAHPVQRLRFVLQDAEVQVLVTRRGLARQLPNPPRHVVCLDGDEQAISARSTGNLAARAKRDDLAYVIYTSGSTGRPKGVPVSHRNVTRLFAATEPWFHFNQHDVWTLFHSCAFDFSVWEIWGALLHGGRLVAVPYWVTRTPEAFYDLVVDEGVTVLNQTPSAFGQLIRVDSQRQPLQQALRFVIFGGEALDTPSLRGWFERHGSRRPQLINMYGITETTVHVTYRPIRPEDTLEATSRIGRAIPDLRVCLLDRESIPVPLGVPGEICVAGPGVASGYLNRPRLTAEKFVPDPLGAECAGRLYRSGDLGRYREDGDIEYLGRLDDQVQIRGFRVERGEIEAALLAHSQVGEAAVLARQDQPGGKRLVAYWVPAQQPPPQDGKREFTRLPNGLQVAHLNRGETEMVYREIFEDESYLRHGVCLHDGACVFDVGANIGLFTLFVHQRCLGAQVYAFEPIPPTFDVLQANVAHYNLAAKLFRCGLSDRAAEAAFTFYPQVSVMSGAHADAAEDAQITRTYLQNRQELESVDADELLHGRFAAEEFTCRLRTLSEIIQEQHVETIDLLKIDVEKSELEVLAGIRQEDWAKIRQVVLEVHDLQGRLKQATALLKRHGFKVTVEQDAKLAGTGLYNLYAVHPARSPRGGATSATPSTLRSSFPSSAELRRHLRETLPEYMVPAAFVSLESLPLSPNGKLDRRALPAPGAPSPHERTRFIAPRDDLEHVVADLFADVLHVQRVGSCDNFFDLGGDSLLATQVVVRLRDTFRADVSIVGLFAAQDVHSLAEMVRQRTPRNQADKIARAVRRLQAMTDEEKEQLAACDSS